jgi:hypothetical protein
MPSSLGEEPRAPGLPSPGRGTGVARGTLQCRIDRAVTILSQVAVIERLIIHWSALSTSHSSYNSQDQCMCLTWRRAPAFGDAHHKCPEGARLLHRLEEWLLSGEHAP